MDTVTQADKLQITEDRLRAWCACFDGYRWFLDKFPQGGVFFEVYAALQADRRHDDSGWLVEKMFAELDTASQVLQTVKISGADAAAITKSAAVGVAAATTGDSANATTTGDYATATTASYRANAATTGDSAVAAALGYGAKVKACAGGAVVLVFRSDDMKLLHIFSLLVGQNGIDADKWYQLNADGEVFGVLA